MEKKNISQVIKERIEKVKALQEILNKEGMLAFINKIQNKNND